MAYLAAVKTNPVYQLLLLGSKLQLSADEYQEIKNLCKKISDWSFFVERAIGTHLAPILFSTFSNDLLKKNLPKKVLISLENAQNQVLFRNIKLQQVFKEFATLLNNKKFPLVPLKGIYLSEKIFKNLSLRHLSDIDVLIKEEHLEDVCDLMQQKGWVVESTIRHSKVGQQHFAHAHPRTLIKGDIHIELHTHLYNRNEGATITRKELWKHTRSERFINVEIRQFSNEMQLQFLCLHLHKHLFGHEMKLLNFCDIREFLLAEKDHFNWDEFENICSKYKCQKEVTQILFLCKKYWSENVSSVFLQKNVNTEEADKRFWVFFAGNSAEKKQALENKMEKRLRKMGQLESKRERLHFLVGFVFPSSDFMRKNYGLGSKDWLFWWYVFRPFSLAVKTVLAVLNRVVLRKTEG